MLYNICLFWQLEENIMTSSEKKEQIETLIAFSQKVKVESEKNLTMMNKTYFDENIINNAREVNQIACKQKHLENIKFDDDCTFETAYNQVKERAKTLQARVTQQSLRVNKRIEDEATIWALYAEVETQYFDSNVLLEDCATLSARFKERPAPESDLAL